MNDLRDRVHTLEQEIAGVNARVSALARSLDQRDASAAVLDEKPAGIRGRVADHVRVREGFEAAVGAALGVYADALLADTAEDAGVVVAGAHERDLGRLRAVIASGGSVAATPNVEAPGLTAVSSVLLDAPDGVKGLLSRTYIADDVDTAVRSAAALRTALSGGSFTVVTASGDVLTEHTLSGGSALAPSRIELTAELADARRRAAELKAEIEEASAELADAREEVARLKATTRETYTELREADARLAKHAQHRQQLVARAEAARGEASRSATALEGVASTADEAVAAAEQAQRVQEEAESQPRPILDASQRDAVLSELERARSTEIELRLAFETAKERVRAAEERGRAMAEQFDAERKAAEEAARRTVLRNRQVARAERVAGALPAILEAADRSLSEARTVQQAAEQERARNSQELTLLRSEESELRTRLQLLTERAHGAELKSYERKLQLSSLLERAGSELGLVEDVLIAEYGPHVGVPVARAATNRKADDGSTADIRNESTASDSTVRDNTASDPTAADVDEGAVDGDVELRPYVREEQVKRLAAAEKRFNELGRINPLALEEFAALEQRHQFLVEQLSDLKKTRADLGQIIEELDEKMQGIFAAAFEDTRLAFAEVFPILFPGGSGEIALTNPDDILATGIDIAVRPAGKKVERLSLLSGGERSLAAVAWLIAIFRARPSPFYIMDEVEAALDDANLGRLLQVFEKLRENSQLIVITHQKRTMEIADALYGVSMRRDGISAVVGQRLGNEE